MHIPLGFSETSLKKNTGTFLIDRKCIGGLEFVEYLLQSISRTIYLQHFLNCLIYGFINFLSRYGKMFLQRLPPGHCIPHPLP